jgi:hypothetical protein
MSTTTADRCHKCFVPYKPQENTLAKIQACDCLDPHIARKLKLSPGMFDFIFGVRTTKTQ